MGNTIYSRRSFILGAAGLITVASLPPGSITPVNVSPIKALGHIDERIGYVSDSDYSYIRRTYMINGKEWHYLMRRNGKDSITDAIKANIDAAAYKVMTS